jgi:hypothetical protein
VIGRAGDWLRREPARTTALLVVAGATATLLLAPYLLAYEALHRLTGLERTVEEVRHFAGTPVSYLITGGRLHYALWSHRLFGQSISSNFPGITALVLVALATAWPETRRDPRVQMCLAAAVGCAAVSMLPAAPFYPALHRSVPLFHAVRVPAHLGQIVLLMVAVIAGFGVAGLSRRVRPAGAWAATAVVLCLLVNVEAFSGPLELTPFTEIPPIYDVLARERGAVILELPFYPPQIFHANAIYMLNSTRHWQPMLNGYSGIRPDSYDAEFAQLADFPSVTALIALHRYGVTHVVAHTDLLGAGLVDAMTRVPSLQLIADDGVIRIYRLRDQ